MSKFKLYYLALISLVSCSSYIYAAEISTTYTPVILDEQAKSEVVTYEEPRLFSIRLLNDSLGYTLSWDAKTKSVLLENEETKISLIANESKFIMNNTSHKLSQPTQLINNTLYAPQEFFELAFKVTPSLENNQIQFISLSSIPPEIPVPQISTEPTETNMPLEDRSLPLFPGTNTYTVDQKLMIKLEENPSTGYQWKVAFPKGITVLEDYFLPGQTDRIGSAGEHIWIIRPTQVSTFVIEFNKLRNFEPLSIIDTEIFKLKTTAKK
ncbi:MAG: protease inhibitor I42 family protein [Niameybacter sp.]|uniref:protease inhibitor I42 family protein n=1 Tax=Niameybacter sp. TaxID=2033640 RepID=UPI002FC9FBD9